MQISDVQIVNGCADMQISDVQVFFFEPELKKIIDRSLITQGNIKVGNYMSIEASTIICTFEI
ncbi:hypothetical protein ACFGVS_26040 [Mucilaginibacter sp. AW1-7]|uniref:hypothetical protein n=1 Tax=Mucilaginibacter sp. AW1-7 TaxID=3349874 RepID=UPI003F73338F